MKSNFDFLSRDFPVLANFGKLAEQYCFSDANSCLIKLGMIGENIVNLIFTYDGIDLPYDNTAVTRIDTLMREGLLTRDLCDILHAIRKARNKATHENYGSTDEAKTLLQMTYSLCAVSYTHLRAHETDSYLVCRLLLEKKKKKLHLSLIQISE